MAAPSELSIQSVVRWGETAVSLKDFTGKYPTPNVVKVTKGQYRNIGVAKSVTSELLLHSVVTSNKILSESIKLREGKKAVPSDQKFSLPLSYEGWFELLSEEGKSIKALPSVQDLFKLRPQTCLVRENVKAFVSNDHGDFALDKTRTVYAGEQLTLANDVYMPVPSYKTLGFSSKRRLLRCVDQKGENVYLGFDQRGLFSPIAGQSNISGVHNIKGLLDKFRMPIMVRLVHGIIPTRLDRGSFTGVFRLVSVYSDETAFVCPLRKDSKMVPVATREPLKLVPAQNLDDIKDTLDFKNTVQRCSKMVSSYMNSIHVLVHQPDVVSFSKAKEDAVPKVTSLPQVDEDDLFHEVDDIYQYVRDGGPTPLPRSRSASSMSKSNTELYKSTNSKTPTDENYWEEPIYERIDKFQKLKREAVLVNSGTTVSAEINQNYTVDRIENGKSESESLGKVSEFEDKKDDAAPPIPPKRFDSDDSGSFEEVQSPDDTASSMGISPDSGDNKDISKSSSGGSFNRSPTAPLENNLPPRNTHNDNSFPRNVSSVSLGVTPPTPDFRDTRFEDSQRRHSVIPSSRPVDLPFVENGRRIMFRSPTEVVETNISTSRINLRSPNDACEGPTRVNVRSPVEFLDNQRKFQRHRSATSVSPNSMNATRIVFNRELQTQIPTRLSNGSSDTHGNKGPVTVTTNGPSFKSASPAKSTPKYVAIARVGDPSPTKKNLNDDNDGLPYDKHSRRINIDNSRRQVQSIFL